MPPSRVCGTRSRDIFRTDTGAGSEGRLKLAEFTLELKRIQADPRGDDVHCFRTQLQTTLARARRPSIQRSPPRLPEIQDWEDHETAVVASFARDLVAGSAFVGQRCAQKEADAFGKSGFKNPTKRFERTK